MELLKGQDGKEPNVKQVPIEDRVELQENKRKGELTDAFFVDLLNENSSDSDSDSDVSPSPNSKLSNDTSSCNDVKNNSSIGNLDSSLNNACEVNQNTDNKKDETIVILASKSVEQSNDNTIETFHTSVNDVSMDEINCCVKNVASDIISEIETSSLQLNGEKFAKVDMNNFNDHREPEEWTDDESASSTSSSDSSDFFEELHKVSTPKIMPVKTKGELDIEDLPPIEELNISVEKNELTKVGIVHAIVTKQVVVQAMKNQTPLDQDSVLFLSENKPLGRVFETFGPVIEPFYVVLFNSPEDIVKKNITLGTEVYFAPKKQDITMYVFLDALRQEKGSDASWADNNEPPEEFLDYSDDEQERIAKMKRRAKNRTREDDDEVEIVSVKNTCVKSEGSLNDSKRSTSLSQKRVNSIGNSSEKIAQYNYTTKQTSRNSVSSENNKFISNRPYSSHNTNSLDNVPVWISSPPPFLEVSPMSSSLQPLSFPQPSTSLGHPKLEFNTNSPQLRNPQLQLRSPVFQTVQQSIPSQTANINAAPVYLQSLSSLKSPQGISNPPSPHPVIISQSPAPFMLNHVNNNTHPPQTPNVFLSQSSNVQMNHIPLQFQRSPMLSNYRQPYVFGQVTPMPVVSSVPFSNPVQNPAMPMHVYATTPPPHMSGNHHWQQREALRTPPQPLSGNANHQWQQREALRTPPQPLSGTVHSQWQQREALQTQTPPLPISGTVSHQWQQREAMQTPPFNFPSGVQIPSFTNLPPVVRFGISNAGPVPPQKPLYYTAPHQNLQFSSRF